MKTVVVTGTSSGIGLATSVLLARNNYRVYATMRDPGRGSVLQEAARSENLPLTILPMDVTRDESVEAAMAGIRREAGHVDVLVNNAGTGTRGPVEELSIAQFLSEMDTNFMGTVRCTKAVLPSMRKSKSGCIINISSVAGKLYNHFTAPYSASKAAVEAFTECLAMEMAPFHVRVALVEPGVTDTPLQVKSVPAVSGTHYPLIRRDIAFFAAAVAHHVPPAVVAEVIREIIEGKREKLRNHSGPDSTPALEMRAALSDEDWIASCHMDEEAWIGAMEAMHLDVRKFLPPAL